MAKSQFNVTPNPNRRCLWPLSNCSHSRVTMINQALFPVVKKLSVLSLCTSACSLRRNRFISGQFAMILAWNCALPSAITSSPFYSSSARTSTCLKFCQFHQRNLGSSPSSKKVKKALKQAAKKAETQGKVKYKGAFKLLKDFFSTISKDFY